MLGYPHTAVELLSRLLTGYPASLLVPDPAGQLRTTEDDVTTSRRLSWLLERVFQCDLSVLLSLPHSMAGSPMIDNILVTSLSSRLSAVIWWLTSQAPQVTSTPRSHGLTLVAGSDSSPRQEPSVITGRDIGQGRFGKRQ